MQIDDMTSGGFVRRWTLIDGRPRCVLDAIPASDAGAVAALQRNAAVRAMIAAVEALEASRAAGQPDAAETPAPVLALADWRAAEPEGGQHETDAMDAAEAEGAPWEAARADALAELDRLAALPLEHDPRPVPPEISDRQFFQALAQEGMISEGDALASVQAGALPPAFDALIAALPASAQFPARMVVTGATIFRRDHPLTAAFGAWAGKSPAQIDDLFRLAAAL